MTQVTQVTRLLVRVAAACGRIRYKTTGCRTYMGVCGTHGTRFARPQGVLTLFMKDQRTTPGCSR